MFNLDKICYLCLQEPTNTKLGTITREDTDMIIRLKTINFNADLLLEKTLIKICHDCFFKLHLSFTFKYLLAANFEFIKKALDLTECEKTYADHKIPGKFRRKRKKRSNFTNKKKTQITVNSKRMRKITNIDALKIEDAVTAREDDFEKFFAKELDYRNEWNKEECKQDGGELEYRTEFEKYVHQGQILMDKLKTQRETTIAANYIIEKPTEQNYETQPAAPVEPEASRQEPEIYEFNAEDQDEPEVEPNPIAVEDEAVPRDFHLFLQEGDISDTIDLDESNSEDFLPGYSVPDEVFSPPSTEVVDLVSSDEENDLDDDVVFEIID